MTLADEIVRFVQARDHVSFAELAHQWPAHFRDGSLELVAAVGSNIVLWAGATREACEAVNACLDERRLELKPTIALVYLIDGIVPGYPVAKTVRHFKTPRWAPTVLCVPQPQCVRRDARNRSRRIKITEASTP